MTTSREMIDAGLQRCLELIEDDPKLVREFDQSRAEFFGAEDPSAWPAGAAAGSAESGLAARRHLEWFALERYSDALGGVPVEALQQRWLEQGSTADLDALLNSHAGVFEVTSIPTGREAWLRDLLSGGEYPLDEPGASELKPMDLVVGRLHPVGDSLFRLSPAATVLRGGELLSALRADVERERQRRRGTMRITQAELERMFHGPNALAPKPSVAREQPRAAARRALLDAGVSDTLAHELLAQIAAAAREDRGGAVTDALNRLAFETDADLGAAQRALAELWAELRFNAGAGATPPAASLDDGAPRERVVEALARFDDGRESGGDLEQLFSALERDLDLEAAEDEDPGDAPDFPGVVGAMIEEFLWETAREHGDAQAAAHQSLRKLGDFASDQAIGVFENLTSRHLVEFAARWVLERGALRSAPEARALLDALGAFCRWCEERHDVALWSSFEALHAGLSRSVPRVAEIRRRLSRQPPAPAAPEALYTFARTPSGGPLLVDRGGEQHEVGLQDDLAGLLREGDFVLARIGRSGEAVVRACYPPELASIVEHS